MAGARVGNFPAGVTIFKDVRGGVVERPHAAGGVERHQQVAVGQDIQAIEVGAGRDAGGSRVEQRCPGTARVAKHIGGIGSHWAGQAGGGIQGEQNFHTVARGQGIDHGTGRNASGGAVEQAAPGGSVPCHHVAWGGRDWAGKCHRGVEDQPVNAAGRVIRTHVCRQARQRQGDGTSQIVVGNVVGADRRTTQGDRNVRYVAQGREIRGGLGVAGHRDEDSGEECAVHGTRPWQGESG